MDTDSTAPHRYIGTYPNGSMTNLGAELGVLFGFIASFIITFVIFAGVFKRTIGKEDEKRPSVAEQGTEEKETATDLIVTNLGAHVKIPDNGQDQIKEV